MGSFPETNIRTYVVGPDGRRGVWFSSLDITRLAAVAVARAWYRLPYCWAKMRVVNSGNLVGYWSRRRWPGAGPEARLRLRIGKPIEPRAVTELEHFLTARWGLWTMLNDRLSYAPVDHPRWPLHRAEVLELDESLTRAAGLGAPDGEPLPLYSPGVDVRVGRPQPCEIPATGNR